MSIEGTSIRILTWSAAACFVAAWFLPVAPDLPGWMAFRYAFAPVWPYAPHAGATEDAAPQVLSALTHVVFAVMFAQLLAGRVGRPGLWLRVAIACFVVDLYWFVQMLRDGAHSLGIGYYVWLAAFAQLAIIGGLLVRRQRGAARD